MEDKKTVFDEQIEEQEVQAIPDETVVNMPRPFVTWDVRGTSYRLKLTTGVILRLEAQFQTSLVNAVTEEGIPELGVLIPLLQGALQKFNHGIKSTRVEELYDDYVEDGHTIIDLLKDVIYPLMYDAGFFTQAQIDLVTQTMTEVDADL